MKRLACILTLALLIPVGLMAQVYAYFDTTFLLYPTVGATDSVAIIKPGTHMPSGASPKSPTVFNWTSGETLYVNTQGEIPKWYFSATNDTVSMNSFPLIGPNSYVGYGSAVDSIILRVPSDSCIIHVNWPYKP